MSLEELAMILDTIMHNGILKWKNHLLILVLERNKTRRHAIHTHKRENRTIQPTCKTTVSGRARETTTRTIRRISSTATNLRNVQYTSSLCHRILHEMKKSINKTYSFRQRKLSKAEKKLLNKMINQQKHLRNRLRKK